MSGVPWCLRLSNTTSESIVRRLPADSFLTPTLEGDTCITVKTFQDKHPLRIPPTKRSSQIVCRETIALYEYMFTTRQLNATLSNKAVSDYIHLLSSLYFKGQAFQDRRQVEPVLHNQVVQFYCPLARPLLRWTVVGNNCRLFRLVLICVGQNSLHTADCHNGL